MSEWLKADEDRMVEYNRRDDELRSAYKQAEERLRAAGVNPWDDDEYNRMFKLWRAHYNSCRQCGSSDTRLENYDMMWHDGDIICNTCDRYVRMYDAG